MYKKDIYYNTVCLIFMLQKDDFTAVSSILRQYLPEKDTPYILDVDLDFFSTKNPFKDLYERVNLYDKLAPLFTYKRAESNDPEVRIFILNIYKNGVIMVKESNIHLIISVIKSNKFSNEANIKYITIISYICI